jgi:sulfite exporter TauE/SafE
MIQYDRDVIQKFAEKLYKQANFIIASYTILGLLLGGVGGHFLGGAIRGDMSATAIGEANSGDMTTTAIVAIVVALIGFAMGQEKAFMLKLQAQTALCQVKIEQNTSGPIV